MIVHVKDTGAGIEEKNLAKIFTRFGKQQRTSDINSDGNGLGLTIVKEIVQQSGGEIGVESKGEGQGSLFCFSMQMDAIDETMDAERLNHENPLIQLVQNSAPVSDDQSKSSDTFHTSQIHKQNTKSGKQRSEERSSIRDHSKISSVSYDVTSQHSRGIVTSNHIKDEEGLISFRCSKGGFQNQMRRNENEQSQRSRQHSLEAFQNSQDKQNSSTSKIIGDKISKSMTNALSIEINQGHISEVSYKNSVDQTNQIQSEASKREQTFVALSQNLNEHPAVLIIDDDAMTIGVFQAMLGEAGLLSAKAMSGNQALKVIQQRIKKSKKNKNVPMYKLLLIDFSMPDATGP